jgi:AGCS family alanine or glycine:cation symporter
MIFAMSLTNILGLYLLAPVVRRELRSYQGKLANGEIQPTGWTRPRRFVRGRDRTTERT